jgi:hypothetical protein
VTQVKGSIIYLPSGPTVTFSTVDHRYDGLNRRIKTTMSGTSYGLVYDGENLVGACNLTASTNGKPWVNTPDDYTPLASNQIQNTGSYIAACGGTPYLEFPVQTKWCFNPKPC